MKQSKTENVLLMFTHNKGLHNSRSLTSFRCVGFFPRRAARGPDVGLVSQDVLTSAAGTSKAETKAETIEAGLEFDPKQT